MRVASLLIPILLLSGCVEEDLVTTATTTSTSTTTSTTLEVRKVEVITDKTNYSDEGIEVTITNGLETPIYLSGKCSVHPWYTASIVIEKKDFKWERVFDIENYGNCTRDMPYFKINPNVTIKMHWNFTLPAPVGGLYRAGVVYSYGVNFLEESISYSNTFFIKAKPIVTTIPFPRNVSYETISKRIYSGHDREINLVINSTEDWQGIWDYIIKNRVTPLPLPDVDFDHYLLLVVFSGVGPGNREIGITKILEHEDRVEVFVKKDYTNGCSRCNLNPHHIVKIKKTNKPIIFHTEK